MDRRNAIDPELQQSLVSLVLGFLGVTALILLLPRTLKYMLRRFVTGIVGEVVAVVLTGLLTEKVVDWIGRDQAVTNGHARPAVPPRAPTPMR